MKIARVINDIGEEVLGSVQPDGTILELVGDIFSDLNVTGKTVNVKKWLSPLDPRAIICVASNYKAHVKECDMKIPEWPVFFMKNLSAVNSHLEYIRIPQVCEDEVDYEGELAIIIGRKCCNVSKAKVFDYILGYTVANDVTARKWQTEKGGGQWCRGKGFDTFCPIGPFLVTKDEIANPGNLNIKTELNGQVVQDGNTNLMIFDIPTLISFLSQGTTLLPGTIILTGTPAGVGWTRQPRLLMKKGDTIAVDIEGVGRLVNHVM